MAAHLKRERPPMPPLAVRVQVAERQFYAARTDEAQIFYVANVAGKSDGFRLEYLLANLFGSDPNALDHDPALILRPYNARIKDVAARYTPHAHDPAALIYREKADHQQKTTGRKPGAERTVTTKGSDIGIKTKFARLERKAAKGAAMRMTAQRKRKEKQKIPSRPFQKGRKFDARR